MNATKEVELLENSQVKVKIVIPGTDIKQEYDTLVKEYCGKLRLPGFRKGKVPPEILIRKLGQELLDETRAQVLEKTITEVLPQVEQKPLPYDTPEVKSEGDLEIGKDFTFELVYDTYPKVELGPYTGIEVEEPDWQITDEDIGRELKSVQNQNAMYTDKPSGVVETGDIANIDYVELLPGGEERPGTKREAFVFEVGTGYNVYKLDEEILGMTKGETKVVTKVYPEDFETKALAGKSLSIRVTLNSIKEKKLPEVNDELAQDINENFKTLDDLKADIRKKLEEAVKSRLRSSTLNTVFERVVESSTIPLPKSLADYQLAAMWEEYMNRLGVDEKTLVSLLERQGKSVEDIRTEWMPAAEKRAKLSLVISEIGKRESIQIEDEELEKEMARLAESTSMEVKDLKEHLNERRLMGQVESNLRLDKLYDFVLSKTSIRKSGTKAVLDILQGN